MEIARLYELGTQYDWKDLHSYRTAVLFYLVYGTRIHESNVVACQPMLNIHIYISSRQ